LHFIFLTHSTHSYIVYNVVIITRVRTYNCPPTPLGDISARSCELEYTGNILTNTGQIFRLLSDVVVARGLVPDAVPDNGPGNRVTGFKALKSISHIVKSVSTSPPPGSEIMHKADGVKSWFFVAPYMAYFVKPIPDMTITEVIAHSSDAKLWVYEVEIVRNRWGARALVYISTLIADGECVTVSREYWTPPAHAPLVSILYFRRVFPYTTWDEGMARAYEEGIPHDGLVQQCRGVTYRYKEHETIDIMCVYNFGINDRIELLTGSGHLDEPGCVDVCNSVKIVDWCPLKHILTRCQQTEEAISSEGQLAMAVVEFKVCLPGRSDRVVTEGSRVPLSACKIRPDKIKANNYSSPCPST